MTVLSVHEQSTDVGSYWIHPKSEFQTDVRAADVFHNVSVHLSVS